MTIFWSKHSLEKIHERNISKDFISQTVNGPDFLIVGRENKLEAYKRFGRIYLKVVYFNRKNHQIIITSHFVEKIKNF